MKLLFQWIFLGLVLQLVLVVSASDFKRLNIWPMPQSVSYGHRTLYLSEDFEISTEGSKYPDTSGILKDGFSRLLAVVHAAHVTDGNVTHFPQSLLLKGIHVVIFLPNDEVCYV